MGNVRFQDVLKEPPKTKQVFRLRNWEPTTLSNLNKTSVWNLRFYII